MQKRISKIKKDLTLLFNEFKKQNLLDGIKIENKQIPIEELAAFKKKYQRDRQFVNKGVVDRLFLEHIGILATVKTKNSKKIKSNLTKLKELSDKEAKIIKTILDNL